MPTVKPVFPEPVWPTILVCSSSIYCGRARSLCVVPCDTSRSFSKWSFGSGLNDQIHFPLVSFEIIWNFLTLLLVLQVLFLCFRCFLKHCLPCNSFAQIQLVKYMIYVSKSLAKQNNEWRRFCHFAISDFFCATDILVTIRMLWGYISIWGW